MYPPPLSLLARSVFQLRRLILASGKLTVVDQLLQGLKARGHRVLLFSQFTSVLDVLEDYCNAKGYDYERIDGSVDSTARQVWVGGWGSC